MGWTFFHREKGRKTLDILREQFVSTDGAGVIAGQSVGSTWYLAYRLKTGHTIGVVVLTKSHPNDRFNWGFKSISEDMGPCDAACPAKILDMLDPIDLLVADRVFGEQSAQWAREWREKSRVRGAGKLQVGTVIRFDDPLDYGNLGKMTRIVVVDPRRRIGRCYFTPRPDQEAKWAEMTGGDDTKRIGGYPVRVPHYWRDIGVIEQVVEVPDWARSMRRY